MSDDLWLEWRDDLGGFALDETNGITLVQGLSGLMAPPVSVTGSSYVSTDGAAFIGSRSSERNVDLFIAFYDADGNVRDRIATLVARLHRGPGVLALGSETRTRELLNVSRDGGLTGVERGTDFYARDVANLVALDPWWHGDTRVVSLTLSGVNIPFDDASTGFDDAVSFDGLVSSSIANGGDTVSFPVVTIRGPFTTATVRSGATGRVELSSALAIGDTISVDTRPGNRGPRLNGGPIDWSLLTETSRLFTIPVGGGRVSSASTGEDVGDGSLIEVSARERHLTP